MFRAMYRKYDGEPHRQLAMRRLGEDEHGVWLGVPANSPAMRGLGPAYVQQYACVLLFPRDGWWTAFFNPPPRRTEVYCDVTTVPEWNGRKVSMIDLDLDVRRLRDGTIELLDADEFQEHRTRYGYPSEVVANAQASAARLQQALREDTEPFASAYWRWLSQVMPG